MTSRFVVRLAALLVTLCVAVPATAIAVRVTVYFAASFNSAGAPGSGITVEVGSMDQTGPAGVFSVVPGPGGGQLRIADSGLGTDAVVQADLKQLFKGSEVTIHYKLTCSQTNASLTMRAEDDADSGLIDVGFGDDGEIRVDGNGTGETYQQNVTYSIQLRLRKPFMGSSGWRLLLKSDTGEVVVLQGAMTSNAPIRLENVQIIRAAGSTPGEFFLDDLRVTSTNFLPNY